jgi:Protein of unknown function (DUF4242)
MKRYVIERNIPKIGSSEREQFRAAAQKSNGVLEEIGPGIQWVQSFVTADKLYCIYLAEDIALIHRHAERSGFPAHVVSEASRILDPTSAERLRH